MKLHLPSGLRKALLACLAAVALPAASLPSTIASASGIAAFFLLASHQASAEFTGPDDVTWGPVREVTPAGSNPTEVNVEEDTYVSGPAGLGTDYLDFKFKANLGSDGKRDKNLKLGLQYGWCDLTGDLSGLDNFWLTANGGGVIRVNSTDESSLDVAGFEGISDIWVNVAQLYFSGNGSISLSSNFHIGRSSSALTGASAAALRTDVDLTTTGCLDVVEDGTVDIARSKSFTIGSLKGGDLERTYLTLAGHGKLVLGTGSQVSGKLRVRKANANNGVTLALTGSVTLEENAELDLGEMMTAQNLALTLSKGASLAVDVKADTEMEIMSLKIELDGTATWRIAQGGRLKFDQLEGEGKLVIDVGALAFVSGYQLFSSVGEWYGTWKDRIDFVGYQGDGRVELSQEGKLTVVSDNTFTWTGSEDFTWDTTTSGWTGNGGSVFQQRGDATLAGTKATGEMEVTIAAGGIETGNLTIQKSTGSGLYDIVTDNGAELTVGKKLTVGEGVNATFSGAGGVTVQGGVDLQGNLTVGEGSRLTVTGDWSFGDDVGVTLGSGATLGYTFSTSVSFIGLLGELSGPSSGSATLELLGDSDLTIDVNDTAYIGLSKDKGIIGLYKEKGKLYIHINNANAAGDRNVISGAIDVADLVIEGPYTTMMNLELQSGGTVRGDLSLTKSGGLFLGRDLVVSGNLSTDDTADWAKVERKNTSENVYLLLSRSGEKTWDDFVKEYNVYTLRNVGIGKAGSGTLTLSGEGAFTLNFKVIEGEVDFTGTMSMKEGMVLEIGDGATMDFQNGLLKAGASPIVVNRAAGDTGIGTLKVTVGTNKALEGLLASEGIDVEVKGEAGSGGIVKDATVTGKMTVQNSWVTFSGSNTVGVLNTGEEGMLKFDAQHQKTQVLSAEGVTVAKGIEMQAGELSIYNGYAGLVVEDGGISGSGGTIRAKDLDVTCGEGAGVTFSGVLALNGGNLTKRGTGTQTFTLAGAGTTTLGRVDVQGGQLTLGSRGENATLNLGLSVASGSKFTWQGGTLSISGSMELHGDDAFNVALSQGVSLNLSSTAIGAGLTITITGFTEEYNGYKLFENWVEGWNITVKNQGGETLVLENGYLWEQGAVRPPAGGFVWSGDSADNNVNWSEAIWTNSETEEGNQSFTPGGSDATLNGEGGKDTITLTGETETVVGNLTVGEGSSITLENGTLRVRGGLVIAGGSKLIFGTGASLAGDHLTLSATGEGVAELHVALGASEDFGAVLQETGEGTKLVITNAATSATIGDVEYLGEVALQAGTVEMTGTNTLGSLSGGTASATLQLGTGNVRTTITGDSVFAGVITVEGGTLELGGNLSVSALNSRGAAGEISSSGEKGNLTITGTGGSYRGKLRLSGGLTMNGTGTQSFTGEVTLGGAVTVQQGGLTLGATGVDASIGGNVNVNSGGTFTWAGDMLTVGGSWNGAGGLALNWHEGMALTFLGGIGSEALQLSISGLTNAALEGGYQLFSYWDASWEAQIDLSRVTTQEGTGVELHDGKLYLIGAYVSPTVLYKSATEDFTWGNSNEWHQGSPEGAAVTFAPNSNVVLSSASADAITITTGRGTVEIGDLTVESGKFILDPDPAAGTQTFGALSVKGTLTLGKDVEFYQLKYNFSKYVQIRAHSLVTKGNAKVGTLQMSGDGVNTIILGGNLEITGKFSDDAGSMGTGGGSNIRILSTVEGEVTLTIDENAMRDDTPSWGYADTIHEGLSVGDEKHRINVEYKGRLAYTWRPVIGGGDVIVWGNFTVSKNSESGTLTVYFNNASEDSIIHGKLGGDGVVQLSGTQASTMVVEGVDGDAGSIGGIALSNNAYQHKWFFGGDLVVGGLSVDGGVWTEKSTTFNGYQGREVYLLADGTGQTDNWRNLSVINDILQLNNAVLYADEKVGGGVAVSDGENLTFTEGGTIGRNFKVKGGGTLRLSGETAEFNFNRKLVADGEGTRLVVAKGEQLHVNAGLEVVNGADVEVTSGNLGGLSSLTLNMASLTLGQGATLAADSLTLRGSNTINLDLRGENAEDGLLDIQSAFLEDNGELVLTFNWEGVAAGEYQIFDVDHWGLIKDILGGHIRVEATGSGNWSCEFDDQKGALTLTDDTERLTWNNADSEFTWQVGGEQVWDKEGNDDSSFQNDVGVIFAGGTASGASVEVSGDLTVADMEVKPGDLNSQGQYTFSPSSGGSADSITVGGALKLDARTDATFNVTTTVEGRTTLGASANLGIGAQMTLAALVGDAAGNTITFTQNDVRLTVNGALSSEGALSFTQTSESNSASLSLLGGAEIGGQLTVGKGVHVTVSGGPYVLKQGAKVDGSFTTAAGSSFTLSGDLELNGGWDNQGTSDGRVVFRRADGDTQTRWVKISGADDTTLDVTHFDMHTVNSDAGVGLEWCGTGTLTMNGIARYGGEYIDGGIRVTGGTLRIVLDYERSLHSDITSTEAAQGLFIQGGAVFVATEIDGNITVDAGTLTLRNRLHITGKLEVEESANVVLDSGDAGTLFALTLDQGGTIAGKLTTAALDETNENVGVAPTFTLGGDFTIGGIGQASRGPEAYVWTFNSASKKVTLTLDVSEENSSPANQAMIRVNTNENVKVVKQGEGTQNLMISQLTGGLDLQGGTLRFSSAYAGRYNDNKIEGGFTSRAGTTIEVDGSLPIDFITVGSTMDAVKLGTNSSIKFDKGTLKADKLSLGSGTTLKLTLADGEEGSHLSFGAIEFADNVAGDARKLTIELTGWEDYSASPNGYQLFQPDENYRGSLWEQLKNDQWKDLFTFVTSDGDTLRNDDLVLDIGGRLIMGRYAEQMFYWPGTGTGEDPSSLTIGGDEILWSDGEGQPATSAWQDEKNVELGLESGDVTVTLARDVSATSLTISGTAIYTVSEGEGTTLSVKDGGLWIEEGASLVFTGEKKLTLEGSASIANGSTLELAQEEGLSFSGTQNLKVRGGTLKVSQIRLESASEHSFTQATVYGDVVLSAGSISMSGNNRIEGTLTVSGEEGTDRLNFAENTSIELGGLTVDTGTTLDFRLSNQMAATIGKLTVNDDKSVKFSPVNGANLGDVVIKEISEDSGDGKILIEGSPTTLTIGEEGGETGFGGEVHLSYSSKLRVEGTLNLNALTTENSAYAQNRRYSITIADNGVLTVKKVEDYTGTTFRYLLFLESLEVGDDAQFLMNVDPGEWLMIGDTGIPGSVTLGDRAEMIISGSVTSNMMSVSGGLVVMGEDSRIELRGSGNMNVTGERANLNMGRGAEILVGWGAFSAPQLVMRENARIELQGAGNMSAVTATMEEGAEILVSEGAFTATVLTMRKDTQIELRGTGNMNVAGATASLTMDEGAEILVGKGAFSATQLTMGKNARIELQGAGNMNVVDVTVTENGQTRIVSSLMTMGEGATILVSDGAFNASSLTMEQGAAIQVSKGAFTTTRLTMGRQSTLDVRGGNITLNGVLSFGENDTIKLGSSGQRINLGANFTISEGSKTTATGNPNHLTLELSADFLSGVGKTGTYQLFTAGVWKEEWRSLFTITVGSEYSGRYAGIQVNSQGKLIWSGKVKDLYWDGSDTEGTLNWNQEVWGTEENPQAHDTTWSSGANVFWVAESGKKDESGKDLPYTVALENDGIGAGDLILSGEAKYSLQTAKKGQTATLTVFNLSIGKENELTVGEGVTLNASSLASLNQSSGGKETSGILSLDGGTVAFGSPTVVIDQFSLTDKGGTLKASSGARDTRVTISKFVEGSSLDAELTLDGSGTVRFIFGDDASFAKLQQAPTENFKPDVEVAAGKTLKLNKETQLGGKLYFNEGASVILGKGLTIAGMSGGTWNAPWDLPSNITTQGEEVTLSIVGGTDASDLWGGLRLGSEAHRVNLHYDQPCMQTMGSGRVVIYGDVDIESGTVRLSTTDHFEIHGKLSGAGTLMLVNATGTIMGDGSGTGLGSIGTLSFEVNNGKGGTLYLEDDLLIGKQVTTSGTGNSVHAYAGTKYLLIDVADDRTDTWARFMSKYGNLVFADDTAQNGGRTGIGKASAGELSLNNNSTTAAELSVPFKLADGKLTWAGGELKMSDFTATAGTQLEVRQGTLGLGKCRVELEELTLGAGATVGVTGGTLKAQKFTPGANSVIALTLSVQSPNEAGWLDFGELVLGELDPEKDLRLEIHLEGARVNEPVRLFVGGEGTAYEALWNSVLEEKWRDLFRFTVDHDIWGVDKDDEVDFKLDENGYLTITEGFVWTGCHEWQGDSSAGWSSDEGSSGEWQAGKQAPDGKNVHFTQGPAEGDVMIDREVKPKNVYVDSGKYTFKQQDGTGGLAMDDGTLRVGGAGADARLTLALENTSIPEIVLGDQGTLVLAHDEALPDETQIKFKGGVLEYSGAMLSDTDVSNKVAAYDEGSTETVKVEVDGETYKDKDGVTWGNADEIMNAGNGGLWHAVHESENQGGGIEKSGTGTFTLEWKETGAQTHQGSITVTGGELQYKIHADAAATEVTLLNEVTVEGESSLTLDVECSTTLSGKITGKGTVRMAGGDVTMNGTETTVAGIQVDRGAALTAGNSDALGGEGVTLTLNGGTLKSAEGVEVRSETVKVADDSAIEGTVSLSGTLTSEEGEKPTLTAQGGAQGTLSGKLAGFDGTLHTATADSIWTLTGAALGGGEEDVDVKDVDVGVSGEGTVKFAGDATYSGMVSGNVTLESGDGATLTVTSQENNSTDAKLKGTVVLGNSTTQATWNGKEVVSGNIRLANVTLGAGGLTKADGVRIYVETASAPEDPTAAAAYSAREADPRGGIVDVNGMKAKDLDGIIINEHGQLRNITGTYTANSSHKLELHFSDENVGSTATDADALITAGTSGFNLNANNIRNEGEEVVELDLETSALASIIGKLAEKGDDKYVDVYLRLVENGRLSMRDVKLEDLKGNGNEVWILSSLHIEPVKVEDGCIKLTGSAADVFVAPKGSSVLSDEDETDAEALNALREAKATVLANRGDDLTLRLTPHPEKEGSDITVWNLLGMDNTQLNLQNADSKTGRVEVAFENTHVPEFVDANRFTGEIEGTTVYGQDTTFNGRIDGGQGVDVKKQGLGTLTVGGNYTLEDGTTTLTAGALRLRGRNNSMQNLAFSYDKPRRADGKQGVDGETNPEERGLLLEGGTTTITGSITEEGSNGDDNDIILSQRAKLTLTGESSLETTDIIGDQENGGGSVTVDGAKAGLTFTGDSRNPRMKDVDVNVKDGGSLTLTEGAGMDVGNVKLSGTGKDAEGKDRGSLLDVGNGTTNVDSLTGDANSTLASAKDGELHVGGGSFSGTLGSSGPDGAGKLVVDSGAEFTLDNVTTTNDSTEAWGVELGDGSNLTVDVSKKGAGNGITLGDINLGNGKMTVNYGDRINQNSLTGTITGVEDNGTLDLYSTGESESVELGITVAEGLRKGFEDHITFSGAGNFFKDSEAHVDQETGKITVSSQEAKDNKFERLLPDMSKNARAGASMVWDSLKEKSQDEAFFNALLNPTSDYDSMASALIGMFDNGDKEGLEKALVAVAGSSVSVLGPAVVDDLHRQLTTMRNRTTMTSNEQHLEKYDAYPTWHAWLNAEGAYRKLDADGFAPGYTLNSWGGTVGVDADVSERTTVGLALTAMYGDLKTESTDVGKGDLDTMYLSAFARTTRGAWSHTVVMSSGMADVNLDRTVNVGGMSYRTQGSTDGYAVGVLYEVGYTKLVNRKGTVAFQPVFNVELRHAALKGYTETGSNAGLKVDDIEQDVVTFGVGARMQGIVGENLYNRTSILEGRLLVKGDVGDRSGVSKNALIGSARTGEVESAEVGALGIEAGVGLSIPLGSQLGNLFFDASTELRSGQTSFDATVGYRISF